MTTIVTQELLANADQRVVLRRMPWSHFEVFLAIRGESSRPRVAYLHGELELMTPSNGHEVTKTNLARLVEAYADETGLELWGYGSWTLKDARREVSAEPDECYVLGGPRSEGVPDLALEVVWTSGGIDKLTIYRKLGVKEVWFWEMGRIQVYQLQGEGYAAVARSVAFPELDLDLIARLAAHESPSQAVWELRRILREQKK